MNRYYLRALLIICLGVTFYSCMPDRMPSEPVEIDRPVFNKFEMGAQSNLNVPPNAQIILYYNEPMNLQSFADHFTVASINGEIPGNFSYGAADTIVVFTPSGNYNPAEYYEMTLTGGVRDIHGNSVASPIGEDIPQKGWFFTTGEYSSGGFPLIFIRDKSNRNNVYRLGNLNVYRDSMIIPGTLDYQTAAIEVEPNSDRIFIVNLKTTDGFVTAIDPATLQVLGQMPVGLGPTNIKFSAQKAYVTNLSARSFSVIDLASLTTEVTHVFADGFRPNNVSFSTFNNSLYFYSSANSDIKKVNAGDFNDTHTFPSGLTTRPTDIEITNDGKFLYVIGTNSNVLSVIDVETETASPIALEYQYLTDGTMGKEHYYVAYYRGTGGEDIGGVLKIDINSKAITGHLEWEYQVDQLKLTAAEELLYAVTPVDSTIQVIETKAMHKITSGKVPGSLKFLAVTKKNY